VSDVVLPIVFPDYEITVETPGTQIPIPDLPFIDIPGIPSVVRIAPTTQRLPYLGHAGAAFFNGSDGTTKYYEYGRYDAASLGIVRRVTVPDLSLNEGRPTEASLFALLRAISRSSGHGGAIMGSYIELGTGAFALMVAYAQRRLSENSNRARTPYDLFTNSCCHFMKDVAEAGGADMPRVLPPNPAGYIRVVRVSHPEMDYDTRRLTLPLLGYPGSGQASSQAAGSGH
jgi:hypothetical protein